MLELDAFVSIHRFLLFKCAAVEQLLKSLIRIVDAKLLKAVPFKDLKAKNVQKADELVPLTT